MKSFLQFLSEAETSASTRAKQMGLVGDGHGDWYDKKGKLIAKTVKGQLKIFGQGSGPQQQATPQIDPQGQLNQLAQQSAAAEQERQAAEQEQSQDLGTLTIAFGRFNPPTAGHEKLLKKVANVAKDGDYVIYPSRSHDPKKNPLDPDTKIGFMKQMFPDHAEHIQNDANAKSIFDVLKSAYEQGYSGVNVVVGSDRLPEFEKLTNNYNGKLYDFQSINVVSAGERDPDADDVSGMSASKLRAAAMENDFDSFMKGMPKAMDEKKAKQLFSQIQQSMKEKSKKKTRKESFELWEVAPKLDQKSLRENFIAKKIFSVGKLVENLNTGLIGRVIRAGANHLICVTEDKIMFKSWITDVSEVD